jgi:hypothetical protein
MCPSRQCYLQGNACNKVCYKGSLFSLLLTAHFHYAVVTLCDSYEVRTESRFHFVVVTLRDSSAVRTESRFHFVVVTLRDSCEVRTESRFHFVV